MRQIHHWAALLFLAAIVVHLAGCSSPAPSAGPASSTGSIGVHAADPGHLQRLRRLLAARRPAVGHRAAHRLLDRAVDPARRARGWRRCSSAASSPGPTSSAGSTSSTSCWCRRRSSCLLTAHLAILVRQKHTQFPGPGRRGGQRRRRAAVADLRGQGARAVLPHRRRAVLPRRRVPDQPDLALRPVRPGRGQLGVASPTGTWAGSTARCGSCPAGRSAPSASRSPTRSSPACCWPALTFGAAVRLAVPRGPVHRRPRRAPPARPAPPAPGAHRPRRGDAHLLHGAASSAAPPTCWPRRSGCRSTPSCGRSGSWSCCCRRSSAGSRTGSARSCRPATACRRRRG